MRLAAVLLGLGLGLGLRLGFMGQDSRADAGVPPAWVATRGRVEPGVALGSYVLTSDAAPGRYSEGALVTASPIALPFRFAITWRRIGPEAGRSMHVIVAGGVVLIKSGAITLYAYDDAAFSASGWTPLPGLLTTAEHSLVVTQDSHAVNVAIDGTAVATFALAVPQLSSVVGVGMKSAPGLRSAIYLRSLAVGATGVTGATGAQ